MRKEIPEAKAAQSFRLLEDDFVTQLVVSKRVNWNTTYSKAEVLSRRFSSSRVSRAIDLLHVAIAAVSHVKHFATFDADQSTLARAAGLNVIQFGDI